MISVLPKCLAKCRQIRKGSYSPFAFSMASWGKKMLNASLKKFQNNETVKGKHRIRMEGSLII